MKKFISGEPPHKFELGDLVKVMKSSPVYRVTDIYFREKGPKYNLECLIEGTQVRNVPEYLLVHANSQFEPLSWWESITND